jgi:hypothetical protein
VPDKVAPQPTAEVVAVASAQRLGAPTGNLVSTKFNLLLGTRPSQSFLYLFEHGLVRVPARGQPPAGVFEACRWDDVSLTHIGATQHYRNGIYQHTSYFVSLRRADGSVMDFSGTFRDPAKARLRTASSPATTTCTTSCTRSAYPWASFPTTCYSSPSPTPWSAHHHDRVVSARPGRPARSSRGGSPRKRRRIPARTGN